MLNNLKTKNTTVKTITTFNEHLNNRYGQVGTVNRREFDIKAKAFAIREIVKKKNTGFK
jgi:hypothetical protein